MDVEYTILRLLCPAKQTNLHNLNFLRAFNPAHAKEQKTPEVDTAKQMLLVSMLHILGLTSTALTLPQDPDAYSGSWKILVVDARSSLLLFDLIGSFGSQLFSRCRHVRSGVAHSGTYGMHATGIPRKPRACKLPSPGTCWPVDRSRKDLNSSTPL